MIFSAITDDITGANKSIGLFGKSLNDFKGIVNSFKQNGFVNTLLNTPLINIDIDAIDNYNSAIKSGIPSEQALSKARRTTNAETIALIESSHGAEVQIERVTVAQKASTIAAKAHSVALKALSIAGNMILFNVIAKGIQLATTALDNWINRSKYAIEAMEKAQQVINNAQSKLKDVSATIMENKDRFLELSEGVDKFSKNIKLSEEDYSEYLSISNKLAETSPELVTGYTDQGDALLYIGENAEETSAKLNKILETEQALAQQSLVDNMDSVAKGIYYEVDNANFEIANLEAELNTVSTVFRDLDNIINTINDDISSINFGTGSGLGLDFDEMEQLKNTIRNSGATITEDEVFDSMIFSSSDIPLVQKAIEDFYKQLDCTRKNESAAYINGIIEDIQERENTIKDAYAKITPNLVAWAKSTYEYDFLGEQQKKLIESLIPTLDWNDIKENTGKKLISGAEYEQYIKENIIVPLMSIPDEYQDEVNKKIAQLLEFEPGDIDIVDFVSEFQEYLDGIGVTIDIKPLLGDTGELKNSYEQITDDAARKFIEKSSKNYALLDAERQALDDFAKENSINTRDEIAFWNQCLEESNTREQAIEKYLSSEKTTNEPPISIVPTISSSIQQLATQLEPQFAKLGEAYQAIFTDNGFTLDNVDNPMLEGLIQSFAEIEEEVGVAFDAAKLDPFFDAITDKSGSAEEQARRVQDAFNELATAYFYSTETLEQLNAETADAIEKQLEEMGVQNAAEVVADALTAKTEELIVAKEYLAQTGKELASATEEEQTAFILEQIEAGNCGEALALLQLKKMLVNGTLLDATSDINNVLALTQAAGITSDALTRLAALKSAFDIAQASGNYGAMNAISAEMEKVKNQVETDIENFKPVEFGSTNATESAAKAGKEAGGAYVDAFEGELEELEQLRDSGVITEKEYLDRLRILYEKYFENKLGYEKEYAKYQRQYLEGYKSLYESALSGISTLLDNQIDGYKDARDAAVSSLTDEKEARLEVIDAQKEQLEAQKDLIDEQIEAKQKLIDDIQDEIDAMKEANAERQRQLDLQKAQYELERMQHQRTILQYSESGGMQYVQDNEGLRTAKENVDNAKLEIEISNKEKNISLLEDEISLLEEQKDAIQNQMDLLDKQAEQVESYYSKMISETEAYYDSLISNMERQKSKWEEIAEIESIARAYSDLEQVAGGMGYSVQDILSGNEQAFEDFKSRYIALLSDLNNNSSFSEGLSYATSGIAQDIDNLEASAATVSESTDDIAANIGEINANAETLSGSLSDINNALSGFSETENITAAADAFSRLGKAVQSVADALNISEDGTIGSLTDALKSLCEMPLCETDDDGKSGGILSKFQALKTAVTDVTSAISGGGSSASADGDASDSSSLSMSSGASGGSSGGLVGAIDSLKSAANDALGGSGSDDSKEQSEGSGIIAQFGQLKNAVTDTAAAIGSGDSKQKEKSKGNSKNGNLISSITSLGSTTAEILTGDGKNEDKSGGVIGRFEQFKDVIGEANEHVTGIATGLSDIDGQTVECTIKVNIEQNGELPSYAQSALDHTKLESSEYHAKFGKVFAKGTGNYKGLPHAEKNALRSEYGQPELTVYPNGTTELTTQPTISDLPKGTIVFNETQTQKIFQNKPDPIGNTYTDGYAGQNTSGKLILTPAQRPSSLVAQELQEECLTKTGSIVDKIISPVTMMSCNMKEMTGLLRNINHINHNGQNQSVNVGDINITCPGITSQEVARQVGAELNHIFSGFHNYADQQSRIR